VSTAISWTNETWNPVVGCEAVSEGCDHCYAKTLHDMRHRAHLAGKQMLPQYHVPFEIVQLKPERLTHPLSWREPRRVFVNSVSDLFHKDVPLDFLDKCFVVMAYARRHTFQILTKRPHRMRDYMRSWANVGTDSAMQERWDAARKWLIEAIGQRPGAKKHGTYTIGYLQQREYIGVMMADTWTDGRVPPNIWLGTSVEHQAAADKRIPQLLETPAAIRFLSCEPLLGPVDLKMFSPFVAHLGAAAVECKHGFDACPECDRGIDWVIVGAESGQSRRGEAEYMGWLASIVGQCRAAHVPPFVKQDSALKSEQRGRIPDSLWIREYPTVAP